MSSTGGVACVPRNLTATPLPVIWDWQGWYVLANLLCMFVALWKDWLRTEFAILLCLMMIYSAQIITSEEAFIGFSNSGVLTVLVLYVVAEGLSATGGVDYFMGKLMGQPKTLGNALIRMMIPVATASAFINNTPLVALMIPIIQKWSKKVGFPPSQLMIPLSFATILGGTITMIGTSTNLVVAGRARVFYCRSIGIFELSPAGVPNALFGIAYILVLAPYLLPDSKEYERRRRVSRLSPIELKLEAKRQRHASWWYRLYAACCKRSSGTGPEKETLVEVAEVVGDVDVPAGKSNKAAQQGEAYQQQLVDPAASPLDDAPSMRATPSPPDAESGHVSNSLSRETSEFILHSIVNNDSPCSGRSVSAAGLRGEDGLYLISVQRGNTLYSAVGRNFEVEPGDLLSFTGLAENFVSFCQRKGLQPIAHDDADGSASPPPSGRSRGGVLLGVPTQSMVQAVVRDDSDLIGRTPKEANFRRKFNAAILSIHRAGHRLRPQKLGQVELKVGDELLLMTNDDFDWASPETMRDLKPKRDPELAKMIALQDSQRDRNLLLPAPSNAEEAQALGDRQFYISMRVAEMSKLGAAVGSMVGKSVEEAGLRGIPGVVLFAIQRQKQTFRAVGPDFLLEAGDLLWFSGERDGVNALRRLPGLADVEAKQLEKLQIAAHERRLVEVVLSLRSDLLHKTVREARFRSRFSAAIVAIHRHGAPIVSTIGNVVLQPGDVLILDAGPSFVPQFRDDANFLLVAELDASAPPRFDKFYIAFATSIAMIALAAGLEDRGINLLLLALWAGAIMLFTECLTGERAMKSINWGVIITVACAFGLSTALERTKVAPIFGNALVRLAVITNTGEIGVLTCVMAATALMSSLVANNAAALLMFPIAAQAAAGLGVDPNKMLFALMFGASDYATPFGYQTNLMVYGPGGYMFKDYVKFGGPFMLYLLVLQVIILYLLDQWWIMWLVSFAVLVICIILDLTLRGGYKLCGGRASGDSKAI